MGRAEIRGRSAGAFLALVLGLSLTLGGCAALGPGAAGSGDAAPPGAPAAVPAGPPDAAAAPRSPAPAAAAASLSAPRSPATPAAPVAILFAGSAPGQAAVAARIAADLAGPAWAPRPVDLDTPDSAAEIDAAIAAGTQIVAAVGPGALESARRHFADADIVFSQVLEPVAGANGRLHGIAPTPPLALQFAAWSELDPGLERIGLIASERFAERLPEAERAAAAIGGVLVPRVSTSDRETLYLFRRLAPGIDGFWLAPDNSVLSATVIAEMLMLAAELGIGVLVFSESLLEQGGLIHVGAPPEHVAALVVDALTRIRGGHAGTLPGQIALAAGAVRVNSRVAAALGLPDTNRTEWLIRERR